MCGPVGIGVASVVGGALLGSLLSPSVPSQQATQTTTPTAADTTQDSKAPTASERRAANSGATTGMNAGPASTLLTGVGGVDPTTLSLDKAKLSGTAGANTLLGM